MTEGLGGKYKAIRFARERILEQERRARELAAGEDFEGPMIVAGEDFEDPVIVAGEYSEDPVLVAGEDSEDPDDPQFRPAAPRRAAAATLGMKKKGDLGDGAGFR